MGSLHLGKGSCDSDKNTEWKGREEINMERLSVIYEAHKGAGIQKSAREMQGSHSRGEIIVVHITSPMIM